jgi:hypothetical protein
MREFRSSGGDAHHGGVSSSGAAPGKAALTDGMAVQCQASTGGLLPVADAPRAPTRISASASADPFDFSFPPLGATGTASAGDGPEEEGMPMGGAASTVGTADLAAAAWKDQGEFKWWVSWSTDGSAGWIVQKITNTYSGTKKDGTAITNASVGAVPAYYECWAVDKDGKITGSLGKTGNRDKWERPALGEGSKGSWSRACPMPVGSCRVSRRRKI